MDMEWTAIASSSPVQQQHVPNSKNDKNNNNKKKDSQFNREWNMHWEEEEDFKSLITEDNKAIVVVDEEEEEEEDAIQEFDPPIPESVSFLNSNSNNNSLSSPLSFPPSFFTSIAASSSSSLSPSFPSPCRSLLDWSQDTDETNKKKNKTRLKKKKNEDDRNRHKPYYYYYHISKKGEEAAEQDEALTELYSTQIDAHQERLILEEISTGGGDDDDDGSSSSRWEKPKTAPHDQPFTGDGNIFYKETDDVPSSPKNKREHDRSFTKRKRPRGGGAAASDSSRKAPLVWSSLSGWMPEGEEEDRDDEEDNVETVPSSSSSCQCSTAQHHAMINNRRTHNRTTTTTNSVVTVAVAFDPQVTVIPTPSPLDYKDDNDDGSNHDDSCGQDSAATARALLEDVLWYSARELHRFRSEARQFCRQLRQEQQQQQQQQQQSRRKAVDFPTAPSVVVGNETNEDNSDDDAFLWAAGFSDLIYHQTRKPPIRSTGQTLIPGNTATTEEMFQPWGECWMNVNNNNNQNVVIDDNNVAVTTRGLEQRACLERQRRKYWTLKYIVASFQDLQQQQQQRQNRKTKQQYPMQQVDGFPGLSENVDDYHNLATTINNENDDINEQENEYLLAAMLDMDGAEETMLDTDGAEETRVGAPPLSPSTAMVHDNHHKKSSRHHRYRHGHTHQSNRYFEEETEFLAAVAQQCSQWAVQLALEEAQRDYQQAYLA
ncbi:hypothetical protein ACA910_004477 [Epithemia clementina (nom. ined.)]